LKQFRTSCAAIGSSHSSRRTSPALDALANPTRTVPPMSVSMSTSSSSSSGVAPTTTGSALNYSAAASNRSGRTNSVESRPVSTRAESKDAEVTAEEDDDDEDAVGELLRDPQGVDKTAQLQHLVDAILAAAGATADDTAATTTASPSADSSTSSASSTQA
jgi:hypothetical protein